MSGTNMLLILGGVFLNTSAQLFLKQGLQSVGSMDLAMPRVLPLVAEIASNAFILGGLSCYVLSFCAWLVVLSRVEVSIAYPMLSLGYIVTAAAGWYFWGESLTVTKMAGIFLICAGVVCMFKS